VKHSKPSGKYLATLQLRYRKGKRPQRGQMLDEFVATTGYHRKYAIALLRGKLEPHAVIRRQPRKPTYSMLDRLVLLRLAALFGQIGSKRLRAALDVTLPALRANGFLKVRTEAYRHLEKMSPATMDRLRVGDPQRLGHGRSLTKPGTLLKQQIAIRTYADWNDKRPGFMEMDLVDHSGGLASFIQLDWTGRFRADAQHDRRCQRLDGNAGGAEQGAKSRLCGDSDHSRAAAVHAVGHRL
jgi:hypothetical protein